MEPTEITQIVDALAAKLGVAADRLLPIAQTLVEETCCRQWLWGAINWGVMLFGLFLLWWGPFRFVREIEDDDIRTPITCCYYCVVGIVTMAAFGASSSHLGRALSPTLTLLESLR